MSLPPPWTSHYDLFLCAHERADIPLQQIIRLIRVHFPSLSIYPIKTSALERRITMLEYEDNDYWVRDVRGQKWAVGLEGAEGDSTLGKVVDLTGKGDGLAKGDKKENKRRKDVRSYYGLSSGGGGRDIGDIVGSTETWARGLGVTKEGAHNPSENILTQEIQNLKARSRLPGGVNAIASNMAKGNDDKKEKARKADQYLLTLQNKRL
ncbi:MAG: hypothetical protein M1812_005271 [Candelaria pacifica]|nr:MAG: hypothetical protein M1812_005271 [Candelaria pacifica]